MPDQTNPQYRVLHSFLTYPNIRFESQGPNETVILLLRQHPATQINWIIAVIFGLLLPLVFNVFLPTFFTPTQIVFFNLLWYTGIFAFAFLNVISWLFNVGIVTNERIVDVDFHNLLYKEISASIITKVEDVTVKTGGFSRSVLDYGNLFVQTAGSEENIEFLNIPHPSEAAAIINNLMGE